MNYLRLFGSPKKNIIIGLVMFLSVIPLNFLAYAVLFQYGDPPEAYSLLIRLVSWAGLITVGVGIVMLGGEKGWWGDLGKRLAQGGLGESVARTNLKEKDIKSMKIAAMVLGILGSVVTFFVSVGAVVLGGIFSAITGEGIFVFVGWLVVLSSILALVGAILTNGNPRVGATLLGIAAIPSILFTLMGAGMFFGLGTLLLVIATVLAYISSTQESVESA